MSSRHPTPNELWVRIHSQTGNGFLERVPFIERTSCLIEPTSVYITVLESESSASVYRVVDGKSLLAL